ncbi:MAG TPA: dephospho-CoA kinase, partial [Balneolaceae bacterium]|nr:dephospho-CoA kinase [Balneolaceae bacterium]
MIKIGITGGIGSGKSTVCEVWKQLGAYIINADELAKEIMISDPIVKENLIKTFGEESFHADGSLNRSFLAEQAFRKGRVEELNAIVHPQIPAEVDALMQKADDEGYKVVVFEAALLLQNLPRYDLDFVVLVLADKTRRSRWVQQRDEVPERMVTDRMERQQNFEEL